MLAHLIKTLPFVAWILVATFETIPVRLEEAAAVDGCHRLGILTRVVFPAAAPGLAVAQRFKSEEGVGRVLLHGTLDLNTTTHVIEFIWSAGGNPLVLNDQGSVQAFTFLQQLAPALAPETRRANWNTTNGFLGTESVYLARNWPFGVHLLVQQAGKTQIKAYAGWRGPVRQAHVLGGEVLGIPKSAPHRDLALELMRYLMSKPV
jgi:trehalose transport system substrate-binding protein